MDSHKLKIILIFAIATMLALYLGIAAATAQLAALAWVGGGLALVIVLLLGRHVWILLPCALGFDGLLNILPGSPQPWLLATVVVMAMVLMRFLMRKTHEFTLRFTWLDLAVLLQAVAVAQAFVRNPTGLMMMGGDLVGGKPYFLFAGAIAGYFALSLVATEFKMIRWAVLGYLAGGILDGIYRIVTQLVPGMGARTLSIYTGLNARSSLAGATFEAEGGRLEGGKDLGPLLAAAAYGFFRPIHTLLPWKVLPFLLGTGAVLLTLLSGYRSIMARLAMFFIAGTLIRRKTLDLVIVTMLGMAGLAGLLASGLTANLPHGAQRILSVIPFADVDPVIRAGAQGSADGRFDMWVLALTTDRFIQNKWLGDGFAYRADEQRAKFELTTGSSKVFSKGMGFIESSMASGSYHGFHVETIRFTGAFGLACAIFLMFAAMRQAWILCRHYHGRPEFAIAAFMSLPFLVYPIQALLIFGAYRAQFPQFIVLAGMLKILDTVRVRELAAAEARNPKPAPEASKQPIRGLPPGRFPQPAMRVR